MLDLRRVVDARDLDAVRTLVREHVDAHSTVHDAAAADALVASLPVPYEPPGGGLWLARVDGEPAGCAALHPLAPGIAEVKRMYVRPACRGRGVARALAEQVIAHARSLGYERLRLGTLTSMHAAQALYVSLGFRPIAAYRPMEFGDTVFYELPLLAPARR